MDAIASVVSVVVEDALRFLITCQQTTEGEDDGDGKPRRDLGGLKHTHLLHSARILLRIGSAEVRIRTNTLVPGTQSRAQEAGVLAFQPFSPNTPTTPLVQFARPPDPEDYAFVLTEEAGDQQQQQIRHHSTSMWGSCEECGGNHHIANALVALALALLTYAICQSSCRF